MALGDFSISYRVSGLLKDLKQLIMARSRLYGEVLDALHADGVEIVSPSFMNQRALSPEQRFASDSGDRSDVAERGAKVEVTPDALVFDKAESAALREELHGMQQRFTAARSRKIQELDAEQELEARQLIARQIERLDQRLERIGAFLEVEPDDD